MLMCVVTNAYGTLVYVSAQFCKLENALAPPDGC